MLELLRIHDLALIEDMELEFSTGMNVLSGETGAGKSFILKAIQFLLGEKLQPDMVRSGREKAVVEALFQLPDEDLVLRRELLAENGRSRLYINDHLSSQDTVRELRARLVLHTSQHGQQKLLIPAYQSWLVDDWMQRPELLQQRDEILKELRELSAARQSIISRSTALEEKRELLLMQQQEIDKLAPEAGEEDRLESIRLEARSIESMSLHFEEALTLLHGEDHDSGLLGQLGTLERLVDALAKLDANLPMESETVSIFRQSLNDLARALRRPAPAKNADLEKIEKRLFAIAQLKRKLHRSLDEIVAMRQEIDDNLSFLDACGLELKQLDRQESVLMHQLQAVLDILVPTRREAALDFARTLETELAGLGFSEHVHIDIELSPYELWAASPTADTPVPAPCIDDKARILWAPNPGQNPQPLDKIASGGEISRFMLALVGLQPKEESTTLIFDEVDAGVGGLTLNRVAERLAALAAERQMLLITHWPQLAARARRHFLVRKEVHENETFTLCTRLNNVEIKEELARMAGGGEQGEAMAQSLEKFVE